MALFWLCSPRLAKRSMLLGRMQTMMGWLVGFFLQIEGDQKNCEHDLKLWESLRYLLIFVVWVFFVQSRISWQAPQMSTSQGHSLHDFHDMRSDLWPGQEIDRKYVKINHLLSEHKWSNSYTNTIPECWTSSPQKFMKIPVFIRKSWIFNWSCRLLKSKGSACRWKLPGHRAPNNWRWCWRPMAPCVT